MKWVQRIAIGAVAALFAGCRINAGSEAQQPQAAASVSVAHTEAVSVTSTGLVTDTLTGETTIADNFTGGIEPTDGGSRGIGAIPPASPDDVGAFRMFCSAGQVLRDDPMFFPGQPGASHIHQFVGNIGTNAYSNYSSLRTSGDTTCGDPSTPLNRSAYWMPAMLDGVGNVLKPDFVNLYYKRLPATAPGCTDPIKKRGVCIDLPNGLRYVFGYNMATGLEGITDPNSMAYWLLTFNCNNSEDGKVLAGAAAGNYHTLADAAAAGCPIGAQIIIVGFAEDCWDGVHLDSTDHRSHMAYATGNDLGYGRQCDPAHPYLIPDMQFQWHFTVDANLGRWHLASDEGIPGIKAGTTLHMDYWEAWSPTTKAAWEQYCINGHLTCASGDLGNGTSIKGAGIPTTGWPSHQLLAITSIPSTGSTGSTTKVTDPAPTPISTPTVTSPSPTPAPTQVCPDGTVILTTQTCPAPKPGKGVGRKK